MRKLLTLLVLVVLPLLAEAQFTAQWYIVQHKTISYEETGWPTPFQDLAGSVRFTGSDNIGGTYDRQLTVFIKKRNSSTIFYLKSMEKGSLGGEYVKALTYQYEAVDEDGKKCSIELITYIKKDDGQDLLTIMYPESKVLFRLKRP